MYAKLIKLVEKLNQEVENLWVKSIESKSDKKVAKVSKKAKRKPGRPKKRGI